MSWVSNIRVKANAKSKRMVLVYGFIANDFLKKYSALRLVNQYSDETKLESDYLPSSMRSLLS